MTRVLIIEDDPGWFALLKKQISAASMSVELADNLESARSELQSRMYDVVIADLDLEGSGQVRDPFTDFGLLIFSLTRDNSDKSKRFPIIVVTGTPTDRSAITRALNDYPGWIWGWHDKRTFEPEAFRASVNKAIETSRQHFSSAGETAEHQYHTDSQDTQLRELPAWTRAVLSVLGLFASVVGAVYLFAGTPLSSQLQPLLVVMGIVTVVLGLLVVMLANPQMINSIMPWILKLLRRNGQSDQGQPPTSK